MKIIAIATLVGEDRKAIEPGQQVDLDDKEAKSLIDRGLAAPAEKAPGKKGKESSTSSEE